MIKIGIRHSSPEHETVFKKVADPHDPQNYIKLPHVVFEKVTYA